MARVVQLRDCGAHHVFGGGAVVKSGEQGAGGLHGLRAFEHRDSMIVAHAQPPRLIAVGTE